MKPEDQERFRRLYAENLRALRLHGKRSKTIDSYSRTLRRVANFFDRCPDDLSVDELKQYFSALLENYSWSTIKVDLCGLQFFHRYVLDRKMEWVKIIRTRSRGETISRASVPRSLHSERPSERLFVLAVSGIRQQ